MDNIKEFWCKDLAQFKDSMLFDSGTQIAYMKYDDGKYTITISLEVAGSVNVDYKGECYRQPSEFPDELREIIKTKGLFDDEDLYVDMNNWFEYIYDMWKNPVNNYTYYDGFVCEWDISQGKEEDIKKDMIDIVNWLKELK